MIKCCIDHKLLVFKTERYARKIYVCGPIRSFTATIVHASVEHEKYTFAQNSCFKESL